MTPGGYTNQTVTLKVGNLPRHTWSRMHGNIYITGPLSDQAYENMNATVMVNGQPGDIKGPGK